MESQVLELNTENSNKELITAKSSLEDFKWENSILQKRILFYQQVSSLKFEELIK